MPAALKLESSSLAARTATRSLTRMLASAIGLWRLPRWIRVFGGTETFRVWPFSEPSWGPVQRTLTVSELEPTAATEPANQTLCDGGATAAVVKVWSLPVAV